MEKEVYLLIGREFDGNELKQLYFMSSNQMRRSCRKSQIVSFFKAHTVLNAKINGDNIIGEGIYLREIPKYKFVETETPMGRKTKVLQQVDGASENYVLQKAQPVIQKYYEEQNKEILKKQEDADKQKKLLYLYQKLNVCASILSELNNTKDVTNNKILAERLMRYMVQLDVDNSDNGVNYKIQKYGVTGVLRNVSDTLDRCENRANKFNLSKESLAQFNLPMTVKELIKKLSDKYNEIIEKHHLSKELIRKNREEAEKEKEEEKKEIEKVKEEQKEIEKEELEKNLFNPSVFVKNIGILVNKHFNKQVVKFDDTGSFSSKYKAVIYSLLPEKHYVYQVVLGVTHGNEIMAYFVEREDGKSKWLSGEKLANFVEDYESFYDIRALEDLRDYYIEKLKKYCFDYQEDIKVFKPFVETLITAILDYGKERGYKLSKKEKQTSEESKTYSLVSFVTEYDERKRWSLSASVTYKRIEFKNIKMPVNSFNEDDFKNIFSQIKDILDVDMKEILSAKRIKELMEELCSYLEEFKKEANSKLSFFVNRDNNISVGCDKQDIERQTGKRLSSFRVKIGLDLSKNSIFVQNLDNDYTNLRYSLGDILDADSEYLMGIAEEIFNALDSVLKEYWIANLYDISMIYEPGFLVDRYMELIRGFDSRDVTPLDILAVNCFVVIDAYLSMLPGTGDMHLDGTVDFRVFDSLVTDSGILRAYTGVNSLFDINYLPRDSEWYESHYRVFKYMESVVDDFRSVYGEYIDENALERIKRALMDIENNDVLNNKEKAKEMYYDLYTEDTFSEYIGPYTDSLISDLYGLFSMYGYNSYEIAHEYLDGNRDVDWESIYNMLNMYNSSNPITYTSKRTKSFDGDRNARAKSFDGDRNARAKSFDGDIDAVARELSIFEGLDII